MLKIMVNAEKCLKQRQKYDIISTNVLYIKYEDERKETIMKKILRYSIAMLLATSMTAPAAFADYSFTDIEDDRYSWAAPAIQEMSEAGYINGYEDRTYRPDNEVTRQEALSLFARVMGAKEDANEKILAIAHEEYDSVIEPYGLTWGKDEIVYLLYKGALKKTDLDTYLKDKEKSTPMSRYEAAIIITKAMGGEDEAKENSSARLDYTDAISIPANAIGYVKYASDAGILKGMEDGSFSPKTSVTRSQIAVMLSRVVEECDYSYAQAKLVSVDTDGRNVEIKYSDGETETLVYHEDTVMKVLGETYSPDKMLEGVSAVITLSGDKLVSIEAVSSIPDETVTGIYKVKRNSSGKLYVHVVPTGATEAVIYECAPDVTMMYEGSPATINSFKEGAFVELELSDGLVTALTGEEKQEKVTNITITEVSITPSLTVEISHADDAYDGKVYAVADNVVVKKNDVSIDMDEIYAGDKGTMTLEYGVITRLDLDSVKTVREGVIKSITYSDRSNIVVSINGEDKQYEVTKDCDITVNGEDASLYDFRVGDTVSLTLESDAVTKIKATASQMTQGNVVGVVETINASYGFINIKVEGSSVAQTVFCKDTTTKFYNFETGASMKMADIKAGDTVQANGSISNGAFVAKAVYVTPIAE